MTPGKDGNAILFFKFEILATNIDWSQILENICQQVLSLNNVLKVSQHLDSNCVWELRQVTFTLLEQEVQAWSTV